MLHQHIRLQLAFYLFIADYKQRIQLTLRDTTIQDTHGNQKSGTEACHSGLLSSVEEQFRWLSNTMISNESRPTKSNSEKIKKNHFCNEHHLYNVLSALTSELPKAVNQYDRQLEGKTTIGGANPARKQLYQLLQKVSLGDINPLQALEYFIISMIRPDGHLDEIRPYLDKSADSSPSAVRWLIHRYAFLATLQTVKKGVGDNLHLKRGHVASLLFTNKADRTSVNTCSDSELQKKCEPYFTELQNEIISAKIR